MRRKWLFSVTLALALALAARPSHALTRESSHFKGFSAFALWETTDATGCIVSDAFAGPMESRSTGAGGAGGPAATIALFVFDQCHFVELVAAEAVVDLDAGAFRINDSLSSAALNTTVQLVDAVSSTTIPVTLALAWSGVGDVSRDSFRESLRFGGSSYLSRASGSFRAATASGTFLVGTTNYAAGSNVFANLASSSNGIVSITR
jgi:hypothetical protein